MGNNHDIVYKCKIIYIIQSEDVCIFEGYGTVLWINKLPVTVVAINIFKEQLFTDNVGKQSMGLYGLPRGS